LEGESSAKVIARFQYKRESQQYVRDLVTAALASAGEKDLSKGNRVAVKFASLQLWHSSLE